MPGDAYYILETGEVVGRHATATVRRRIWPSVATGSARSRSSVIVPRTATVTRRTQRRCCSCSGRADFLEAVTGHPQVDRGGPAGVAAEPVSARRTRLGRRPIARAVAASAAMSAGPVPQQPPSQLAPRAVQARPPTASNGRRPSAIQRRPSASQLIAAVRVGDQPAGRSRRARREERPARGAGRAVDADRHDARVRRRARRPPRSVRRPRSSRVAALVAQPGRRSGLVEQLDAGPRPRGWSGWSRTRAGRRRPRASASIRGRGTSRARPAPGRSRRGTRSRRPASRRTARPTRRRAGPRRAIPASAAYRSRARRASCHARAGSRPGRPRGRARPPRSPSTVAW